MENGLHIKNISNSCQTRKNNYLTAAFGFLWLTQSLRISDGFTKSLTGIPHPEAVAYVKKISNADVFIKFFNNPFRENKFGYKQFKKIHKF